MRNPEDHSEKVSAGEFSFENGKAVFKRDNLIDGSTEHLEISTDGATYRTDGEPFGSPDVEIDFDMKGDYTAEMLINDLEILQNDEASMENISRKMEKDLHNTDIEEIKPYLVQEYINTAINKVLDERREEKFNGPRYIY